MGGHIRQSGRSVHVSGTYKELVRVMAAILSRVKFHINLLSPHCVSRCCVDSNPRSQQASGRRPTPYTARLLGPAVYLCLLERRIQQGKTSSSIERTTVSRNWFKQLNTSPVLHFSRCLTAEYNEMSHNSRTLQQQLRYWQPNLRTVVLGYVIPVVYAKLTSRKGAVYITTKYI